MQAGSEYSNNWYQTIFLLPENEARVEHWLASYTKSLENYLKNEVCLRYNWILQAS